MILKTSDRFLRLPCASNISLRFTSADRFPTPDKVPADSLPLAQCRELPLDA